MGCFDQLTALLMDHQLAMTIVCMYAMLIGCDYDSNTHVLPAGAILQELCSYGLAMLATDSNATWCLQQLVSDLRSPQEVTRPTRPHALDATHCRRVFSLFGCCLPDRWRLRALSSSIVVKISLENRGLVWLLPFSLL